MEYFRIGRICPPLHLRLILASLPQHTLVPENIARIRGIRYCLGPDPSADLLIFMSCCRLFMEQRHRSRPLLQSYWSTHGPLRSRHSYRPLGIAPPHSSHRPSPNQHDAQIGSHLPLCYRHLRMAYGITSHPVHLQD